jgi:hypothetical protein
MIVDRIVFRWCKKLNCCCISVVGPGGREREQVSWWLLSPGNHDVRLGKYRYRRH